MNGKIKKAFSEIHADEDLKQQTLNRILSTKKKPIPMSYKLAPIMAACLLLFLGNMYFTPVSFISIDINPSIELSVNTFDRVIGVTANNEDAQKIVDSVGLNNMNYVDALEQLDEAQSFSGFSDSYTEVTVISDSSDEIIEHIEACSFNHQNMTFHSANQELKDDAMEHDISFGKYRAYLELLEFDSTVEIDDIRRLPMAVIRQMIEGDDVYEENLEFQHGNGGNGNGNRQQNGSGKQYRREE